MDLPDGFVNAERVSGVVKVPERVLSDGTFLEGVVVGPGDTAIISKDEALSSDFWKAPAGTVPSEAQAAEEREAQLPPAPKSSPKPFDIEVSP